MGRDFWPYGLTANEKVLRTFLRYSYEQGWLRGFLNLLNCSPPSSLETYRI